MLLHNWIPATAAAAALLLNPFIIIQGSNIMTADCLEIPNTVLKAFGELHSSPVLRTRKGKNRNKQIIVSSLWLHDYCFPNYHL